MTAFASGVEAQSVAALAAAAAAGAALVVTDRRRAAAAALLAAGFAALALLVLVDAGLAGLVRERPVLAGAAVVGAAAVAALAAVLRARPGLLVPLLLVAVPFRVPVPTGEETANLLVPLYGVVAAACIAYAAAWLRPGAHPTERPVRARGVRMALAAVLVLYALQSVYSTDVDQAVENLVFFYVPFALAFVVLVDAPWTPRVLRTTLGVAVGLALVCAVVGIAEFATGRLLIVNDKVLEANELKPYFRVNSLFFDPNIYGRFLALAMIALAAVLLWSGRSRSAALASGALVVLWAGLVLSLSQSSFAALLVGLAILAALRWRIAPVVAAALATAAASAVVVVAAPAAIGLETGSERAIDRATSGRVDLVQGALRMIGDRPVAGFGSGAFAERYRAREGTRTSDAAAVSHTTPLTVAAEQGLVGLLAYVALLASALAMLFGGLLRGLRERPPDGRSLARAVVAAAFCGLLVHTFAYASFLEDPLTWLLLAAGVALHPGVPASRRRTAAAS